MKIGIPMMEKSMDRGVNLSFGRTPWFLIHDTDTGESKWLKNSAAESAGGAGIQAAQILVDSGIDALLTFRCGQNAGKVLQDANISVYRSTEGTAKENIEALISGVLPRLSEFHAGFHGHG